MQQLDSTTTSKMVYLINTRSGGGQGAELLLRTRLGKMVEIHLDRIDTQLTQYLERRDRLVVAGGDGTISLVINALFRQGLQDRISLYLLPLGTGNDLARSLGIPVLPASEITELWHERFVRKELPIWRYGDRYFVNYISWGMDAKMLSEVERYRKIFPANVFLRKIAFTTAGLRHIGFAIEAACSVETDGQYHDLRGKAGVIISNLPYYAGGSPLSTLDPDEPRLSVTIVDSAWDLIRLGLSRHLDHAEPVLPFFKAARIRLHGPELPMQIDGEVGRYQETDIRYAGKIGVWVPEGEG